MVVASFLVKHLLIDWRLASNGSGTRSSTPMPAATLRTGNGWRAPAPTLHFRVFNPILQGEKFDPDGVYVRRWVPELAQMPDKLIHQPWTATPLELASAGIELGKTYPRPIVDHKAGRERALKAYATIRGN